MSRRPLTLRSADGLRTLSIDLELERDAKVATLHMLEFDTELVCEFVAELLRQNFGVRIGDAASFSQAQKTEPFELVIVLAGRRYPASLVYRGEDGCSLLLGDPDAAYLERCQEAIEQVLRALNEMGIEAVVEGIDDYGRPRPYEGFLHLFAATQGEQHQEERVISLANGIGQACGVDLFAGFSSDVERVKLEPHFAWDPTTSRVVLRKWGGNE